MRRYNFMASTVGRGVPHVPATHGELHAVDVNILQEIVNTPSIFLLNGTVRGDDIADRTGRRIMMKTLILRVNAWQESASPLQNVRFWVVYDRQPNGSALSPSDVLTAASVQSLPVFNNRDRYVILVDKMMTFPAVGGNDAATNQTATWVLPLNRRVDYNTGSAGTVADIQQGSLYLMVCGEGAASPNANQLRAQSRVIFADPQ